MNQNRNSISDLFCDTYVRISAQCSYILLPKLLTNKRLWEHPQFLLSPTGKAKCLEEFEGVPAYRIRHKYRKAIRELGDSPTGLYGILNQLFSESAIKDLFSVPNVWVLNHNALAKIDFYCLFVSFPYILYLSPAMEGPRQYLWKEGGSRAGRCHRR